MADTSEPKNRARNCKGIRLLPEAKAPSLIFARTMQPGEDARQIGDKHCHDRGSSVIPAAIIRAAPPSSARLRLPSMIPKVSATQQVFTHHGPAWSGSKAR